MQFSGQYKIVCKRFRVENKNPEKHRKMQKFNIDYLECSLETARDG